VAAELRRGGFTDAERVERWDVAFAGLYLDAVSGPGTLLDRLLQPLNRLATQRFLREAREKVWAKRGRLEPGAQAGRWRLRDRPKTARGPERGEGRRLAGPGQVLLKLASTGFGVRLPGCPTVTLFFGRSQGMRLSPKGK
jgi:hypothetical protein